MRLSAIGDITHTLPILNTIKSNWSQTRITWIIGKTEHALVHSIPGVRWVVFDKSLGWKAYGRVKRQLAGDTFDLMMLMQLSMRANFIPLLACKSDTRLGFDYARARNLHSLTTNCRIAARRNEHVLDSFFGFTDVFNMERRLVWDRCYDEKDIDAARQLCGDEPYFVISPCSSHALRNWSPSRYARVADYIHKKYHLNIVLTAAPNETEKTWCDLIEQAMRSRVINLAGKSSIRELAALIAGGVAVLAPDSGPAHLATSSGTKVISLFAATNPDRATPYMCRRWCVNRYPDAARIWLKKDADEIAWGTKIERNGVMELISVDDVVAVVDEALADYR